MKPERRDLVWRSITFALWQHRGGCRGPASATDRLVAEYRGVRADGRADRRKPGAFGRAIRE
jgi:hypothetical protein